MTPNRAAIFFLSSTFASSVKDDESRLEHEPWFNVAYQKEGMLISISLHDHCSLLILMMVMMMMTIISFAVHFYRVRLMVT